MERGCDPRWGSSRDWSYAQWTDFSVIRSLFRGRVKVVGERLIGMSRSRNIRSVGMDGGEGTGRDSRA